MKSLCLTEKKSSRLRKKKRRENMKSLCLTEKKSSRLRKKKRRENMKSLGKNYMPRSQSFADGFLGPKGDVGFVMEFDLEKAKTIDTTDVEEIEAGLDGDFEVNSQTIFENGKWVKETYFYDHSIWATPIILVKYKNKPMEAFECWKKEGKQWGR